LNTIPNWTIPKMSKSRIGATTAISAIACPLSFLTRGKDLRTIPLSKIGGWVHD